MRIWSIHPQYLDSKGLVALWRETLLAQHVLAGKTKGYTNHPQLDRFKNAKKPLDAINEYLSEVYHEACARGYNFDKTKIDWKFKRSVMPVTKGQMDYEQKHLLDKLETRDPEKFNALKKRKKFDPHPMFEVMPGKIEKWEIITGTGSK
ncbi:MAG TPA: pyrimidine dimer DNA glycosylase/endonuclease V [Bacteroidia bacterium]|nr:pyrimidine dimer DNA glycosylase/endonuclease V [Bacteroidia bacterium]